MRLSHGIEQEWQVVHPRRLDLLPGARDILQWLGALAGPNGTRFSREAYPSQIESRVGVCRSLGELAEELESSHVALANAAHESGYLLLGCGVNPVGDPTRICFGEHHHVGIDSDAEAVAVHNMIRRFCPELIAMSGNSPLRQGRIARCKSLRLRDGPFARPAAPVRVHDLSRVRDRADGRRLFGDANVRYWDVSPFSYLKGHKRTVEIRLFDMQPDRERSVAYAALLQALALKARRESGPADGWARAGSDPHYEANRRNAIVRGLDALFEMADAGSCAVCDGQDGPAGTRRISARDRCCAMMEYVEREIDEMGAEAAVASIRRLLETGKSPADEVMAVFRPGDLRSLTRQLGIASALSVGVED